MPPNLNRCYKNRKTSLVRKAIELSEKCQSEVRLTILDHTSKEHIEYKSCNNFEKQLKKAKGFTKKDYTNDDYLKVKHK